MVRAAAGALERVLLSRPHDAALDATGQALPHHPSRFLRRDGPRTGPDPSGPRFLPTRAEEDVADSVLRGPASRRLHEPPPDLST